MSTTTDRLPVIQKEVRKVEQQITDLVVNDDASLAEASDRIKVVKDLAKKVKAEKEKFTAPAKEIISAAKAKYDPILDTLEGFETLLKEKAGGYMVEQEKKRKEAEAKIAARVEKGTMRPDTAMAKLEELPDQSGVRTANSGLRVQMRRDVECTQMNLLTPIEIYNLALKGYLVWDMVKVRKDALAGAKIQGVKIIEKAVTQSI